MAPTIVLISGANRGLGKGLLAQYISKSDHIVIAANRDPSHPTSKALSKLPTGVNSKLVVIKTDGSSPTSAQTAIDTLPSLGINHLDLVIANAGVSYAWPSVIDLKIEDLEGHFIPNVYGAGSEMGYYWEHGGDDYYHMKQPLSSHLEPTTHPNGAHGPSKAAIHWLTKRMNVENPPLNAFVLDPGWCQTELGNAGAVYFGMDQAAV
ncbi:uncharacterized protein EAE97_006040 [Botrytis byssoidea]|uniref:Aflatoxin biosynthesis ketoreductase nor-1 n=1 Tax=Botrytis byssoidea TaxID=139641 RepID=A0A9P5IRF0_9HELO|nr:uncharacterized protein EAE97_006040 [Botrytis byssoidea]KAF7942586.1 hypothetical protein EAE97_006040 [Botrytis byssoidea]